MRGIVRQPGRLGRVVRWLGVVLAVGVLSGGVPPLIAHDAVAEAATRLKNGRWDVTGTYDYFHDCLSVCLGRWVHTMTLRQAPGSAGDVSGSGHYIPEPDYTWTVTGTVQESSIRLLIFYTGSSPGYTAALVGTIADDGSMRGTWTDSNGASGVWLATEAPPSQTYKSHGQLVRNADDKNAAARKAP